MIAAYVTIGRGAGNRRMGALEWVLFQDDVATVLKFAGTDPIEVVAHAGSGEWEGTSEDSFIQGYVYSSDVRAEQLRADLARLAKLYHQDAIALIMGDSELIEP